MLELADGRPLARAALVQLLSPGCVQFTADGVAPRAHEAITSAVFARHATLLADAVAACLRRAPAEGLPEILFTPLQECVTRHLQAQASLGLTREQGLPVVAVIRAVDTLLQAKLEPPLGDEVSEQTE